MGVAIWKVNLFILPLSRSMKCIPNRFDLITGEKIFPGDVKITSLEMVPTTGAVEHVLLHCVYLINALLFALSLLHCMFALSYDAN